MDQLLKKQPVIGPLINAKNKSNINPVFVLLKSGNKEKIYNL